MLFQRNAVYIVGAMMLVVSTCGCVPQQSVVTTPTALPMPTALPALEPIPTRTPVVSGTAAFAEIKALEKTYEAEIGDQSGWIHRETSHISDSSVDHGVLPNGQKIPNEYRMVDWYFLDDTGMVVQASSIMVDTAGQVVQEAVFTDHTTTNLTLNQVFSTAPHRLDFSGGIENDLSNSAVTVVRTEPAPGQVLFEIMIPAHGVDEGLPSSTMRKTRSLFDTNTGAMLSTEMLYVASDGQERLFERVEVLVSERVESPPAEVMKALGN